MNLKLIIVGLTMSLALVSLIPNGQNAERRYRQMYELQKVSEKKKREATSVRIFHLPLKNDIHEFE